MSVSVVAAPNAFPVVVARTEPPATSARPPLAPRERKAARVVPSLVQSMVVDPPESCRVGGPGAPVVRRAARSGSGGGEEGADRFAGLVEGVPEDGVPAG